MVPPTVMLDAARVTFTEATGIGITVIAAEPVRPSLEAVIDVDPSLTAVTTPLASTVATAMLVEVHVTLRPVRTLPAASFICAVA